MSSNTDKIALPRNHSVAFPDMCIVCEQPQPGSRMTILTFSIGWWSALFLPGLPFMIRPPACPRCGWKFKLRRLVSIAATLTVCSIVIFYVWPWLDLPRRGLWKYAIAALALLALLPIGIIQALWPPPLDVTVKAREVEYEFRSRPYAIAFLAKNRHAQVLKVNGSVGSSRVDLQACKLEYSIVSPK